MQGRDSATVREGMNDVEISLSLSLSLSFFTDYR